MKTFMKSFAIKVKDREEPEGDYVYYVACNDDMALTLLVRHASDELVRRGFRRFDPYGLATHVPFPLKPQEVARPRAREQACEWLDGAPCWSSYDTFLATEFWKKYAQHSREQGKEFWHALAALAEELFAAAVAARPAVIRCSYCDGLGYMKHKR